MSRTDQEDAAVQAQRTLAVERIEDERAKAIVNADLSALERLTAPDYVHVETSGRVRTRSEFLAAIDPAAGRYERYENFDSHIQLYGDAAIVSGWFENAYRRADGTRSAKRARHVRVYVLTDGRWLNVVHQATECPAGG